MKRLVTTLLIFSLGMISGTSESNAIETFEISSLSAAGDWTSVLESGQLYMFQASGTWICSIAHHNAYGTAIIDAEWENGPEPPYDPEVWVEVAPVGSYAEDIHDLLVDDVSVDWLGSSDGINWEPHTFSPDHVYRYYYTGTGAPVHLYICDWTPYGDPAYWDNQGSLYVDVIMIPEPGTVLLFGLGGLGLLRRRQS